MQQTSTRRSVLRIAVGLMLVAALLLSACGSGSGGGTAGSETPGAQGPNPASERGNHLVVAQAQDPGNWDPIDTFFVAWASVTNNVFEGLVFRGPDLKLQPGLATEWKWIDEDTLQFKLRQGVTFHNGEPFNADAVVFTFERLLGEEGAKGPQQGNYASIDRVEKVDDYTVNFHMKTKDPVILTKLAGYGAVIVPPRYLKEHGDEYFDKHPVGTGPYKVVEYKQDDHIILERFADYWRGQPKIEKITYRFIPEEATRIAELTTGRVDIAVISPSQVDNVKNSAFLEIVTADSPTVYGLRFDVSKAPVDDVRVRRAIAQAIDAQAIIDTILKGYGKRISTFQSSLSFGNDPSLEPYPYDPEAAKKLLQEAGVQPGTKLTLSYIGTATVFGEIAQAVQSYLKNVGLEVELKTYETNTFYNDIIPNAQAGHLYQEGWGGWTLDFDNTAYLLYGKGQFWNPTFYDEEVQRLLEAERSTYDQDKRLEIFKQLDRRLYELVPTVPLYQDVTVWAVNRRVQDFVPPPDTRYWFFETSIASDQ
ncbi:ABC transporter substrate-binding protein [Thermaerobacter sp. PB12/4term]|uniref:ABC transporter substrate-binding protein n=1 Tax=Thermaerobacter sp. PB12/4term TaxID=2293838 RepID=UPI000E32568A|nr:ABC transporter substrate-binding protein [Thermaerobacter sp. PB12/4term]